MTLLKIHNDRYEARYRGDRHGYMFSCFFSKAQRLFFQALIASSHLHANFSGCW
jgi:hypothetical protein